MKKRILWILTGGTFSCTGTESGLAPCSSEEQAVKILSLMPQIIEKYEVTPLALMNIDSSDITTADHKRIGDTIDENVGKYDGIVITHGTDTMAYTAAVLSVMLRNPPIPVVLTGSQRPFFDRHSDAPENFADAFTVSDKASTGGIFVVFGGRIMNGRDCTKIDTISDDAFCSATGNEGKIANDSVTFPDSENHGRYNYDNSLCKADGKVALLDMHPSFNPDLVGMLYAGGIRGFVIRCYGAGGMPEKVRAALGEVIAKGAKAIAVTQCLHGGADLGIYAVGTDAEKAGVVDGGYMTAEYALAVMMKTVSDIEQ